MRRAVIILAFTALLVISIAGYFWSTGPDLSKYEPLKTPRIGAMSDQRMLVVEVKGDPNIAGKDAFGLLFKTYFKIPGVPKSMHLAPRARWAGDMTVKSSWTGWYALPVPDNAVLPAIDAVPGLLVRIETWQYGTVGEILHIGPYAEEKPTIERLHRYLKEQGYTVTGYHEEEYVKGPGMFFPGDPKGYYTIIRYQVAKKEAEGEGKVN